MDPTLLVIAGPTGSGKSTLALHMAQRFGGEIINADSVQLYRGFDIGSAKTPIEKRAGIPHHLLDVLDSKTVPSAGAFARLARTAATEIFARGRLPVMVGGTGFYVRAFLDGLPALPSRDDALRQRLETRTPERLHRLLQRLDSAAAGRLHPNDPQRLVRALEIRLLTGKAAPSPEHADALTGFQVLHIGLQPPPGALAANIARRSEQMFLHGLVEEVQGLLALGCTGNEKPFEAIGYRQVLRYLRGELTQEAAIEQTTIATRQYAKRQRTWLRRDPRIHWLAGFGDDPEIQHQAEEMFRGKL